MEEEEHKAVAFNVYQAVAPGFLGYLRRVIVMGIATFEFMIGIPLIQMWLIYKSGNLFNLRAWGLACWHLWISPGIWRHVALGVFSYLKPGFHPDKRRVDPRVLEWREHYRATRKREIGMHPTLFGES